MSTSPTQATVVPISAKAILAEMVALRRRVAALERRLSRRQADPTRDARLLSALAIAGITLFSARDVRRHARLDAELGAVLEDATSREVGAWLRRLHQQPTGPYTVCRGKRGEHGTLWSLAVSPVLHAAASADRITRVD